jgi:hypothetical protein
VLTAAAAITLITLVGCSGSSTTKNSGPTSATSQTSSVTASTTPSPSPSASVTYKPGDPRGMGAWSELGLVNVRSNDERAVVDAYFHMDQVGLQAFNTHVEDDAALNAVLQGEHLKGVRSGIQWRMEKKVWTVGREVLNVLSVQLQGDTATLRVCNFDGTSEVDGTGQNITQPPGSTGAYVTFVRRGGVWRGSSGRPDPAKCDAVALLKKGSSTASGDQAL